MIDVPEISIRRVDSADVLRVRTEVLRPGFQEGELAHFDGDELDDSFHYLARSLDGTPIACVSFMRRPSPMGDADAIQLRGMAVIPAMQGRGVGMRLLAKSLIELPFLLPNHPILWCNARESALEFYLQNGFVVFGERFEVENIGPHFVAWREFPLMVA